MRDFTYSEARQNLASLLEIDQPDGAVRIRRRDGHPFVLQPEPRNGAPPNVGPVKIDVAADETARIVREDRERHG